MKPELPHEAFELEIGRSARRLDLEPGGLTRRSHRADRGAARKLHQIQLGYRHYSLQSKQPLFIQPSKLAPIGGRFYWRVMYFARRRAWRPVRAPTVSSSPGRRRAAVELALGPPVIELADQLQRFGGLIVEAARDQRILGPEISCQVLFSLGRLEVARAVAGSQSQLAVSRSNRCLSDKAVRRARVVVGRACAVAGHPLPVAPTPNNVWSVIMLCRLNNPNSRPTSSCAQVRRS